MHAFADQGLSLSCLKNYRNLVSPVALIETSPGVPQSPRISLPEAAEYYRYNSNKSQTKSSSSFWYWLIGLTGLVIAFFKFRKPSKPVTAEANPSNQDS